MSKAMRSSTRSMFRSVSAASSSRLAPSLAAFAAAMASSPSPIMAFSDITTRTGHVFPISSRPLRAASPVALSFRPMVMTSSPSAPSASSS